MACLTGEVHLWTMKHPTLISDLDIGCHSYHDKEKGEGTQLQVNHFQDERKQFNEARDVTWIPKNRRPEKLRDTLKESEELLSNHKCINVRWKTRRLLQIVLSNGVIISYIVSAHSGDVDRVFIDKSLVGKLACDVANDAIFTDYYMVLTYAEKGKIDFIHFGKKLPGGEAIKKLEKISVFEPKITQMEIPGPTARRLDRRLSSNINQDMILVWWPTSSEEAWPWSPMTSDKERANISVLSVNGPRIDVMCYTRTECDPVTMCFSRHMAQQVFTIEQSMGSGGEMSVDSCVYEVARNRVQRAAITTIPLKTTVISHGRNLTEDKLLLGCDDNSIVLYDDYRKITQMTQAAVTPNIISWHPDGVIVFIANYKGDIQIFDTALAPLNTQLISESISPQKLLRIGQFFRTPPGLNRLDWCPCEVLPSDYVTDPVDSILICFERGPLAMYQLHLGVMGQNCLSPVHLVNQYIKYRQVDEAVNLLTSYNWNTDGQMCFVMITAIMNHLLKMPLNVDREALLEATLGAFYAPTQPLTEATVLEYRDAISRFARRFFHHLLRYSRFDKAFLLAVDIGSRDLFMDIHYLARDKGELALAEVAKKKAEQIEIEAFQDTTESCTSYEDELSQDGEGSMEEAFDDYYETDLDKPYSRQKSQSNRQTSQQGQGSKPHPDVVMDSYGRYGPDLDSDLASELYSDYTQALLDDPSSIQPTQDDGTDHRQVADETASSVKVIHFGVV